MQNFPVFPCWPQDGQVQSGEAAGLGLPQLVQNFPVLPLWPHDGQVQEAGCSGFGFPQFMQNFPVFPCWPQEQVQPSPESGAAAGGTGCDGGV